MTLKLFFFILSIFNIFNHQNSFIMSADFILYSITKTNRLFENYSQINT